jgi:hypothetical protein
MQERGRTQEKGTKPFRGETRFEAINVNQPLNLASPHWDPKGHLRSKQLHVDLFSPYL